MKYGIVKKLEKGVASEKWNKNNTIKNFESFRLGLNDSKHER
jgi:hypothetical protein